MEKLKMQTADMAERNVELLGQMFPNCLTETINADGKLVRAIDFDKLRQELACEVVEGAEERYQFTWPDKRAAIRLANAPTNKTLRPCREESVDFDNTENLYIEGDNLEVLKLLRENYLGKVKMIYIDPPYNTGNDFVYNDDFAQGKAEFEAQSGLFDEEGRRMADPMVQNTESNGRFHTDWLNMIYPRLKVAKDLLADDGVIFISIDDNEEGNLQKVCNEIFGENNFVGQLIHQRAKGGGQAKYIVKGHDYVLVYAKIIDNISLARKKVIQKKVEEINGELYIVNDDIVRKMFGKYDKSLGDRRCFYEELTLYKGEDKKREIDEQIKKGEVFLRPNEYGMHTICRYEKVGDATSKMYSILKMTGEESIIKVLSEEGKKELDELQIVGFSYPKPLDIIKQLVDSATIKKSTHLILDFFSGSATTAHAVMQLNAEDGGNRRFIMVQLPELTDEKSEAYKAGYKNICEIGKERIRRAGKKIKEENASKEGFERLDVGFRVLKLDESNMADVYYTPADTPIQTTLAFDALVDNIREGRTAEDLLFQVLPECNLPLSSKIEIREIHGKKVFVVEDGYLMACFDKDINEAVITAIAKEKPYYFVMCDRSIATDNVADNFDQIFNAYSKETVRRIL